MLAKNAKKDAKHAIITIKIQYAQVALVVLHYGKLLLKVENVILQRAACCDQLDGNQENYHYRYFFGPCDERKNKMRIA